MSRNYNSNSNNSNNSNSKIYKKEKERILFEMDYMIHPDDDKFDTNLFMTVDLELCDDQSRDINAQLLDQLHHTLLHDHKEQNIPGQLDDGSFLRSLNFSSSDHPLLYYYDFLEPNRLELIFYFKGEFDDAELKEKEKYYHRLYDLYNKRIKLLGLNFKVLKQFSEFLTLGNKQCFIKSLNFVSMGRYAQGSPIVVEV